tara:strand:- start:362 stop:736 length:375 start_codon:yes stop_codon:yes gene_type:complete
MAKKSSPMKAGVETATITAFKNQGKRRGKGNTNASPSITSGGGGGTLGKMGKFNRKPTIKKINITKKNPTKKKTPSKWVTKAKEGNFGRESLSSQWSKNPSSKPSFMTFKIGPFKMKGWSGWQK